MSASADTSDAIKYYYAKLFPSQSVHRWASRGWVLDPIHPGRREWGWEGIGGAPFVRWKSNATPSELATMVAAPNVGKINLGAVYTTDPCRRHQESAMTVWRREIVVDIDLDDYGIGVSKHDLAACDRHWPLVAVGLEMVRLGLHDAFGFEMILPVYSGRRGGHLWVCDERACCATDEVRDAVAKWFMPTESKSEKQWWRMHKHPNFSTMFHSLLLPFFRETAVAPVEQGGLGMFEMPFQRVAFVEAMGNEATTALRTQVRGLDDPTKAVACIERWVASSKLPFAKDRFAQAVWDKLGPRIDANVTRHANHTLKIPFSVHPGTARISVPILFDALDKFPVARRAPTVASLHEGDAASARTLSKTIEAFDRFIDKLASSRTEAYTKPRVEDVKLVGPPAKKQCVHSLVTQPDAEDTGDIRSAHTRVVWKLRRSFTVCTDADNPSQVNVTASWCEDGYAARCVVLPNEFPPYTHERHYTPDSFIQWFVQAVSQAFDAPGRALHAGSKCTLFIVCGATAVADCQKRLDRLVGRMAEPVDVCTLKHGWEEEGWKSMLNQKVVPLLADQRLI